MRVRPVLLLVALAAGTSWAQLPPVPVPPENPITEDKRILGKILFWEEQLASDSTVACGTCHDPRRAGADGRIGIHPGLDDAFGTPDDVAGSPGVARVDSFGVPVDDPLFGFGVQVTGRSANPVIGSAYAPEAFWDGRAGSTFLDPQTLAISIAAGGALENQAVGPILSDVEMAHEGRTWDDVIARLETITPLRFAGDLPPDVLAALDLRPTYDELFEAAFATPGITAERIGFAIATYERTLIADDTPWDQFMAGDNTALTADQQQGWNVFQASDCAICHAPPLFTDNTFRNIGLRPVAEDAGREEVTGLSEDAGRFKVPTLRNVGLKPTFMHTGELTTVLEAVQFYGPGNQVPGNLDPLLPVPIANQNDVVDFLENGLTDSRVATGAPPFDAPSIFGGLDPVTLLFFDDPTNLTWPAPRGALSYRVYRGDVADLEDLDADGLPDAGYGDCISDTDLDDTDTLLVDTDVPAPGGGFFYLKTVVFASGESDPGTTSEGLARLVTGPCP